MILGLSGLVNLIRTQDYKYLSVTFLFWVLLSGLGIAVGFHRVYSHRCFTKLSTWLDFLLLACGTLAGQGSSLSWVGVHMGYHHRYCDKANDPHTPVLQGFWYSVFLWYYRARVDEIYRHMSLRPINHLLRNRMHQFAHRYYTRIIYGFAIALAGADYYFTGNVKAAWYGYSIALMWAILQDNLVNYFGHAPRWGYRRFDDQPDQSSNFPLLGYLGWGQGWHNNHHALPDRFNFGVAWWEYDPCRLFLPLLRLGGTQNDRSQ